MNNFTKSLFFSFIFLGAFLFLANYSSAQILNPDEAGVSYPIIELGNCSDQASCAAYCDQAENMEACVDFASSKGMIAPEEAAIAKKAIVKIKAGETPGGCKSKESCETFCQNDVSSLNACISFAEEIGVSDAEQAKKIAVALQKGASMPGACSGKKSCEAYCQDVNNIDECLVFAEAAEILPPEEIAEAKKVAPFLKSGKTPGACKTKDDCKTYCDKEENFNECINFAKEAAFISEAEAEIAVKTGGKGPGNCRSKQTCEEYCDLPENAKVCADFALEKGLFDEDTAKKVKNSGQEIGAGLEKIPQEARPDAEACLNNLFGGKLAGVLSGEITPTKRQGEGVGFCFSSAVSKFSDSMKGGPGAIPGNAGGQSIPGMPSVSNGQNGSMPSAAPDQATINKALENAPAEVRKQVEQEIEGQKQKAMQEAMQNSVPKNIPSGGPVAAPSVAPSAPIKMPTNIPDNAPISIPSVTPGNPGKQGPPCSSEAECRAMFGGAPPEGMMR